MNRILVEMNRILVKIIFSGFLLRGCLACQHPPIEPPKVEPPVIKTDTCRSPFLTYEKAIKPIFEKNCTQCHGANSASKGIRFDYYDAVKYYAGEDSVRFFCVINQRDNCTAMPTTGKMDSCIIQQLMTWVRLGLPRG
jgi:hypothetical protein